MEPSVHYDPTTGESSEGDSSNLRQIRLYMNEAEAGGCFGSCHSEIVEDFLPHSSPSVDFDPATGKLNEADSSNKIQTRSYLTVPSHVLNASRQHSSDEFITEVNSISDFYKMQSLQTLGESNDRVSVPICIESANHLSVAPSWIPHIQQAINDINFAAPGLCLHLTTVKSQAKVEIFGNSDGRCFTQGNIVTNALDRAVEIHLDHHWKSKKRTSCHELLHALGFSHEHQRRDRDLSIHVPMEKVSDGWKRQYQRKKHLLGITRFDPYSIMMYPEDKNLRRNAKDKVWFTKPTNEFNEEMSELDKVGLNNLYHPCKGPNYFPSKVGSKTCLWYCGR